MTGTLTIPTVVPHRTAILAGALPAMTARFWLWGAVLVFLSAVALSRLVQTPEPFSAIANALPLAQTQAPATQKQRCESCGVVEDIRELAPEGEVDGRRFQMTVRMRD